MNANHWQNQHGVIHSTVRWREDGTPVSTQFDDIYFSATDGVAESQHVFLQHNQLPQRFVQTSHFTIGETGFGTGLNFLLTWQTWQQYAPNNATLHFISVEKYPLTTTDWQRVQHQRPNLQAQSQALSAHYDTLHEGWQTWILNDQVQLSLFVGEAMQGISGITTTVDAWYLDGFSPAKNPGMWTQELFQTLFDLSQPGTTVATFTAASMVRQGLTEAGFSIQKVPGFGRKRDMLCGVC